MGMLIRYNTIAITSGGNNGGIYNGQNQAFGWMSHFKLNTNSTIWGILNPSGANLNFVGDNDLVDAVVNDQDVQVGTTGQSL